MEKLIAPEVSQMLKETNIKVIIETDLMQVARKGLNFRQKLSLDSTIPNSQDIKKQAVIEAKNMISIALIDLQSFVDPGNIRSESRYDITMVAEKVFGLPIAAKATRSKSQKELKTIYRHHETLSDIDNGNVVSEQRREEAISYVERVAQGYKKLSEDLRAEREGR